ncbi:MAG: NfeD family protein [Clostridia bacterium]|nr:NfeD family protein [Clostridia bacterium]
MTLDYVAITWAVLIVVFTIVEALTLGLTSIWFAVGSLAALITASLGFGLPVQIIVFVVVAVVLLVYTRPIAKKVLKIGHNKTNIDALIGQTGYVVKSIEEKSVGQVKLGSQIWTAKGPGQETFEVDEAVEVLAIEGVKLIVRKVEKQ